MRRFLNAPAMTTAIVATGAVLATPSHAALIACPASFTADGTAKVHDGSAAQLTAAMACQYDDATDNNTVASIANINASGFFGVDTWEENPGQLQVNAEASSGLWAIADVDFDAYDYIIVFKDGQDTNLIAFLFNEEFSDGGWDTPFVNPPFPVGVEGHEVSHYTIARFEDDGTGPGPGPGPEPVPEPGTLAVVGAALAGWWALRRRKGKL